METKNYDQEFQKLLVITSFWGLQSVLSKSAVSDRDKLGIMYGERRRILETLEPKQTEYLDYLIDGRGSLDDRLDWIWKQIWNDIHELSKNVNEVHVAEKLWIGVMEIAYPYCKEFVDEKELIGLMPLYDFTSDGYDRLVTLFHAQESSFLEHYTDHLWQTVTCKNNH